MNNREAKDAATSPGSGDARDRASVTAGQGQPGSFVFTLDTELAWGSLHHGSYAGHERDFERTRYAIDQTLSLFEKYGIRGTWAVVGHLFLASCREQGGVKHPEIVRPRYSWFPHDWLHRDPCGTTETDPWWYGPDIIEKIKSCKVPQEVGCHNFTHAIVGDPGCSREAFASELRASKAAAATHGIEMSSFVFPRNAVAHLDVLAAHGFTSYRSMGAAWHDRLPRRLVRFGRLADDFLPLATPVTRPVYREGLWEFKASYRYLHRNGWARFVPVGMRVRKAVASLRRAARQGAVFHLWTHPFNIASDPDRLLGGLERIFQEVKTLSDSGLLVSRTMTELVELSSLQSVSEAELRAIPRKQAANVG